jgi:hypothetical protein
MSLDGFLNDVGEFPVYFLENFYNVRLTYLEQELIKALHDCYFIYLWIYKKRECARLPPPCVGSQVEIWCIFQIFLCLKASDRKRTVDKYVKVLRDEGSETDDAIVAELRGESTSMVDSILGKISRSRLLREDDDTPYFEIYQRYRNDPNKLFEVSEDIASKVKVYGKFPVDFRFFRQVLGNLSDEEKRAIDILYSQIIWSQYIKDVKYMMPDPRGTGMEIWLMIKLVLEQNGETYPKTTYPVAGLTVGNAYLSAVYLHDEKGYNGDRPFRDITWVHVRTLYNNIATKTSAESQRLYFEKYLAFGMSTHRRLGERSIAQPLSAEIVRKIWKGHVEGVPENDYLYDSRYYDNTEDNESVSGSDDGPSEEK